MRTVFSLLLVFAAVYASNAEMENQERPIFSTELMESTRAPFGIWVDPANWKPNPTPDDPLKIDLRHVSGELAAWLNAEPAVVPFDSLVECALNNFKTRISDIRLCDQARHLVSGREILFLTFEGTLASKRCMAYGYYYSGTEGTVQLTVCVPAKDAQKHKQTVKDLLNGLQIGRVPAPE